MLHSVLFIFLGWRMFMRISSQQAVKVICRFSSVPKSGRVNFEFKKLRSLYKIAQKLKILHCSGCEPEREELS